MTLEQFLEALEKTPRDWQFWAGTSRIRTTDCECPVVCVANGGRDYKGFVECGELLGLPTELTNSIVDAADDANGFYGEQIPGLRAKLLKACGLA